ncbi:MAG: hypothetical protein R2708_19710 [Vicinamibacterales bacterium]
MCLQFVFAATLRIDVMPGLNAGPATAVLFPLTTFVVLLTYVEDDAEATRQFAYGVVICNLTLYLFAALAGQHIGRPGLSNPLGLPRALFEQPWRLVAASSIAIVLDMIATVVLYEWLTRHLRSLVARLWLTAAAVMVLDAVVFTTAFLGARRSWCCSPAASSPSWPAPPSTPDWSRYVTRFERQRGPFEPLDAPGDVFRWLTYRQRYEEACPGCG